VNADETQTTDSKLPTSDFVQMASRIAQLAAGWAADTMVLPEDLTRPMRHEAVRRFAEDIITRVHRITERARNG